MGKNDRLTRVSGPKGVFRLTFGLLLLSSCPGTSSAQQAAEDFHLFSRLNGIWIMKAKKGNTLYEDWKKKDKNTLTGKSYYLSGKDTVLTERHELVLKGNDVFYMANPTGQNNHDQPVPFKLVSSAGGLMIFENKEHDFPQRVVYKVGPEGDRNLLAWIEGEINGRFKKIQYPYTRL
ncbi:MAG TPA: DUF6265 family protein [Puia sp.]|nr:DUF6265 family protein [Puia sp.]